MKRNDDDGSLRWRDFVRGWHAGGVVFRSAKERALSRNERRQPRPSPSLRTCHPALAALLGAAAAMLPSCAPSPLADDWYPRRALSPDAPTFHPPVLTVDDKAESPLPKPDEPVGALTLRRAVALALLYNPELAAFAFDVRAAEARAVQAGLSPNPRAGYSLENLGGPEGGDLFVRQTVRISQVLELAGKRRKRIELAAADRRLAAWDYEDRRLGVIAEVGRRFIAVVAAQQRIDLSQRTLALTKQVYDIVDERVKAGVVPPAQRDKAAVRVSLERIAQDRATQRLRAAKQALASLWGGGGPAFGRAAGELDPSVHVPELESLVERAREHPRLARWDDEIEQRRRAIDLARANGVPDATAGAGLRHFPDADDVAGVVELSLPLPIIDRNQGRVLEARYSLGKARSRHRAAEAAMREALTAAHADLASARFAVDTLNDETLPAARSALAAAQDAFRNGTTDFLNVLDAERTLVDAERALIDARETLHAAAATLEGLTAAPLADRDRASPRNEAD